MILQKEWMRRWFAIPLFLFVSALAYLPHIGDFGYFRDDWYLMYAANAAGGDAFQGIYAIDRPARALIMSLMYSAFGIDPLYYNISAYILRVLGALAFLWTLRMLWPRQRSATALAGLLFLIYPGFVSTPNAIDYQAQQVAFFLAHLSIALSVKAVVMTRRLPQALLWSVSVVMTWAYLGFVEYFLGLEVFRFAAIGLLAGREAGPRFSRWLGRTLSRWSPFAVGPLGFVLWRFFLFDSERKATDLGAQLSQLFESSVLVIAQWIKILLQDSFEVLVLSWGVPLTDVWNIPLRLRELMVAAILAMLAVLAIFLLRRFEGESDATTSEPASWWTEAFWLGLISVLAGFLPVVLSNREANFSNVSRYMLASSSGAVILVAALIDQFRLPRARIWTASLLVSIAVLTHYFNGIQWARSSIAMQSFWWQVSWRIPQIQPGTTLVANYSHTSIEEDYFVWGPANLIYYPQSTDSQRLRPALWSLVLSQNNVVAIQTEAEPVAINRRSILTFMDYGNILILTQPTPASCVQVIDGNQPVISGSEEYNIQLIANASDESRILLEDAARVPPRSVFGPEPEHGWCYFYEQASLAYQRGDWETVRELGKKAARQGFSAGDPVEWMPFLQAAARLGDREEMLALAPKVKKNPFLASQACTVLSNLPEVDEGTRAFIDKIFCQTHE